MVAVMSDSCPERCPMCRERCYGSAGHSMIATAGRKSLAELHQCRKHCWGTLTELRETLRANEAATRREIEEGLGKRLKSARQLQYETTGG
jgi:hypothetical protein